MAVAGKIASSASFASNGEGTGTGRGVGEATIAWLFYRKMC